MTELPNNHPPVVSAEEWRAAREAMLIKEKAHTRARDALAAERRRMPWMRVEKDYVFEGPDGKMRLRDLFAGRRQLILYRAFFEPGVFGWPDHACRGCSLGADQVSNLIHLNQRDTTLAYASRAPQPDIARLKARVESGKVTAIASRSAGQSILAGELDRLFGAPSVGIDRYTAEGLFDLPYEIEHEHIAHLAVDLPVPVGFWRSVGHSYNGFFMEGFLNEVAADNDTSVVVLTGAGAKLQRALIQWMVDRHVEQHHTTDRR